LKFDSLRLLKWTQDHPGGIKLQATGPLKSNAGLDSLLFLIDSSGALTDARLNATNDSIQFKIFGFWVSKIPVSGTLAGIKNITQLKTLNPADGTVVITQGSVTAGDDGVTTWIYSLASTATANDLWVVAPNSNLGRWTPVVYNKKISLKQVGVFPSSDNTVNINLVNIWASSNHYKVIVPANSTYIVDPSNSTYHGIGIVNNMWFQGVDSATSVIKAKTYSGSLSLGGGSLFYYLDLFTPVHDVTIENLKLDGNQKFAGYVFSSSPITDTGTSIIYLIDGSNSGLGFPSRNVNVKNNAIKNGGTYVVVQIYNVKDVTATGNSLDSIGAACFYINGSNVKMNNNIAHYFGMRDTYDAGGGTHGVASLRFGANFLTGYGDHLYINDNWIYNDALTRWFWTEIRAFGYCEFNRNHLFGMGMNCYGFSGGNDFTHDPTRYMNGQMNGNIQDSILCDKHLARDSTLVGGVTTSKYYASNLIEFGGMDGFEAAHNYLLNAHFTIGRHAKNMQIHDNKLYSLDSDPTTEPGGVIMFGIAGGSTGDTTETLSIYNNDYRAKSGEFIRVPNAQSWVNGLDAYENTIKWTVDMIVMELYPPSSGPYHQNIRIHNHNRFIGPTLTLMYTDNTSTGAVIDFSGNDLSATQFYNFVNDFHVASIIDKRGTIFSSGLVTLNQIVKTSTYTVTPTDDVILADATSGAFTITLPTAAGTAPTYFAPSRSIVIKRVNSGANAVTIVAPASQTIDGGASYILTAQYKYVTLTPNGSNWLVTGNN
jgi:hypothetical protein